LQDTISYVPFDYAEALGRATIEWTRFETAIDVLLVLAAKLLAHRGPSINSRLSDKLERLESLSNHRSLEPAWRETLKALGCEAARYQENVQNAATGTLYGRGVEGVALTLRGMAERYLPNRGISRMTTGKLAETAKEIANSARLATVLSVELETTLAKRRQKARLVRSAG
jgi:hypothetical protein